MIELSAEHKDEADLQSACRRSVHHWVTRGNLWLAPFGKSLSVPDVRFNLRGLSAGMAVVPRRRATGAYLRINTDLLHRFPDEMINETVPHEVAHLVSHAFCGRLDHGKTWKQVMAHFGKTATRCHQMPATPARKQKRHPYLCGCREHRVGPQINARIRRGQVYLCRVCSQPLRASAA